MLNKSNFKEFIEKGFSLDPNNLKQNEVVDVSHSNIEVLSFNIKEQKDEWKLVTKLIRKTDSKIYKLKVLEEELEFTQDHRVYVKLIDSKEPTFLEISECIRLYKLYPEMVVFTNIGWQPFKIIETDLVEPIYDIEVKDNHNFYTGSVLSHNTMFGDPRTTNGGHALKFYSHMRVEVSKSLEKDGTTVVANTTKCKVIKNKLAAPFKEAVFTVNFGTGISTVDEILDLGNKAGILKKWGKTVTYPIGEGEQKYDIEEFRNLLIDNEDFYQDIKTKILSEDQL